MPEFGMMFRLPADFSKSTWYGKGPEENYQDRSRGYKVGVYSKSVAENMVPYLVPQECGNHTEVRWARITDESGLGLLVSGQAMNFSALPFTPHEIENAGHGYELPQVHHTVVRVSKNQMGIGGDDSWGAQTHPEYLVYADEPIRFEFMIKGIDS